MTTILSLLLFGISLGVHTVSGNFPRDLYGPVDLRDPRATACTSGPCIWGNAEHAIQPIKFNPPAGYRVRILTLRGDLVAWIKSLPGCTPTPLESTAGVLGGFHITTSQGSVHCDLCADGT